jgi:hypothetical protein
MVSQTKESLKSGIDELELMAKRGIKGKNLSAEEVCNLEPSLKRIYRWRLFSRRSICGTTPCSRNNVSGNSTPWRAIPTFYRSL